MVRFPAACLTSLPACSFMYVLPFEAPGAASSVGVAAAAVKEEQEAGTRKHVYGPHHVALGRPKNDFTARFDPTQLGDVLEVPLTKRQKRMRRAHVRDYCRNRIFAEADEEVRDECMLFDLCHACDAVRGM